MVREELHEMHFEPAFLLKEINKSGAEMNFAEAEFLRRVDKQGEERRTGAYINKRIMVVFSRPAVNYRMSLHGPIAVQAKSLLSNKIIRRRERVGNMPTSVRC
jgi:hypothetical protein